MKLTELKVGMGVYVLRARMEKIGFISSDLYGFMLGEEFWPATTGVGEWDELEDEYLTFTAVAALTREFLDAHPQRFGYIVGDQFVALTGD